MLQCLFHFIIIQSYFDPLRIFILVTAFILKFLIFLLIINSFFFGIRCSFLTFRLHSTEFFCLTAFHFIIRLLIYSSFTLPPPFLIIIAQKHPPFIYLFIFISLFILKHPITFTLIFSHFISFHSITFQHFLYNFHFLRI